MRDKKEEKEIKDRIVRMVQKKIRCYGGNRIKAKAHFVRLYKIGVLTYYEWGEVVRCFAEIERKK